MKGFDLLARDRRKPVEQKRQGLGDEQFGSRTIMILGAKLDLDPTAQHQVLHCRRERRGAGAAGYGVVCRRGLMFNRNKTFVSLVLGRCHFDLELARQRETLPRKKLPLSQKVPTRALSLDFC